MLSYRKLLPTCLMKRIAIVGSSCSGKTTLGRELAALLDVKFVELDEYHWLPDWHPNSDYRREYSARWDLGGGAILDSHEFDYLTWLLGPVKDMLCLDMGLLSMKKIIWCNITPLLHHMTS